MDIPTRDKDGISSSASLADGRMNEAANGAHDAIDHTAQFGHQAIDKAMAVVTPTEAWIRDTGDTLKAAPGKALANTRTYVAAHPLQSIAMALAAGLLIGRFKR